nr:MAG TPA_asm: hypothetical protein [Caudoviricetes sp.]
MNPESMPDPNGRKISLAAMSPKRARLSSRRVLEVLSPAEPECRRGPPHAG